MQMNSSLNGKVSAYPGSITLLISVCFFLSGLADLIYEVVWARQLSLFLVITSYAHTAVITACMAGLAAGSFYFGRYADRRNQPVKIYAWLEIGVMDSVNKNRFVHSFLYSKQWTAFRPKTKQSFRVFV